MKKIPKNKGFEVIEIVLIIAVILVTILFLVQKGRNNGYFTTGYTRTSTNSMGQTTEVPNTSSTTYTTTTTTTTGGGSTTVTNTNGAPVITLYGNNPYSIYHPGTVPDCEPGVTTKCPPRTDFYSEPGYKAYDKEDGDITSKVKTTEERVDYIQNPGPCTTYNINYTVTDSQGNKGQATRVVNECNGA